MFSATNNEIQNIKMTGTHQAHDDQDQDQDASLHISQETYNEFFKEYFESVQNDESVTEEEESDMGDPVHPYIIERQRQMSKELRWWLSIGLTNEDLDAYRQCVANIKELHAYYLSPSEYNSITPIRLLQDIVSYNETYDKKRRDALELFTNEMEAEGEENDDDISTLLEEVDDIQEDSEEETEQQRRDWEEWYNDSREMDRERSWREDQLDDC
jgi:hypothetical protein